MEVEKSDIRPAFKMPRKSCTGVMRIDATFRGHGDAKVAGATVSFEPGARTVWHTHPLGQTLIVVSGVGWVQSEGGSVETIRPGDIVWISPGERHWHGATATAAMSHISIEERVGGVSVDYFEHVSDQQYMAGEQT